MNRNQRRSKLAFVLLGTGLVVTLAGAPASAALSNGAFFVHAQNSEDPSIQALAGLGGLAEAGGSPGGNPGDGSGSPVDTSPSSLRISAGPLNLNITEDMLALSEANRKAQKEGRFDDIRTHAEGWQTIWWIDPSDQSIHPGITDKNGAIIFLSSSSEDATLGDLYNLALNSPGRALAFYVEDKSQDIVQAIDRRNTPKEGDSYIYNKIDSRSESEGRYMMSEGKLIGVYVIDNSGLIQLQREPAKLGDPKYTSNRFPYLVNLTATGEVQSISVRFPDKSNGYSSIDISDRPDLGEGMSTIQYNDRTPGSSPYVVTLKDGQLVQAYYEDETGGHTIQVSSAADYNAATGSNWNGKLYKFSDFDTSIPFSIGKY